MQIGERGHLKSIIDRKKMMDYKTCAACGNWDGPPKLVHEKEAVYDTDSSSYIAQKCFDGK